MGRSLLIKFYTYFSVSLFCNWEFELSNIRLLLVDFKYFIKIQNFRVEKFLF